MVSKESSKGKIRESSDMKKGVLSLEIRLLFCYHTFVGSCRWQLLLNSDQCLIFAKGVLDDFSAMCPKELFLLFRKFFRVDRFTVLQDHMAGTDKRHVALKNRCSIVDGHGDDGTSCLLGHL